MLDSDEGILDGACSDQFIQLHLDGCAVPVLRVLDQETIRNVTMVVPVLMTSCQVSENRNRGPVTAQMTITVQGQNKGRCTAGRLRCPVCNRCEKSAWSLAFLMPLLHSVLLYLERLAESIAGAMGVPRRPLRSGKATLNAVLASAPEPTFDLLDWCFHWPVFTASSRTSCAFFAFPGQRGGIHQSSRR